MVPNLSGHSLMTLLVDLVVSREPRDPRAVSDPQLLADEFLMLQLKLASAQPRM